VKHGPLDSLILITLGLIASAATLWAEIPPLAPDELLAEADMVVVGTVTGNSSWPKLKGIQSVDTIYKITVEVESVEKGAPELVGKKVTFQAWQTKKRPPGWVGPGGIWKAGQAVKGAKVKIYASGTEESANVLQPNGLSIEAEPEATAEVEPVGEAAPEAP